MATERLDLRIDKAVKAKARKAYVLKRMKSMSEYIERLIDEDAERVIREHESVVLKNDVFDRFMSACEAAEAPNAKLRAARKFVNEQGIQ